jgi:required for meiotic nuclear division protein 1
MGERIHEFNAVAFVENLTLRECTPAFSDARLTSYYELHAPLDGGDVFVYGFGAVVFRNVDDAARAAQLQKLHSIVPGLTHRVVEEQYVVKEDPGAEIGIVEGVLKIDRMTVARAGVIALTVAQSAAMEYYEKLVDGLFARTEELVDRLEVSGTVSMRTRPLHRFIGRAIGTRNEVLAVLHLLDKPDATWEDPAMDRIYADLRAEFDLIDRYESLTSKLKGVQEALELILDVARDQRLVLLETAIVLLIVFEIVLGIWRVAS